MKTKVLLLLIAVLGLCLSSCENGSKTESTITCVPKKKTIAPQGGEFSVNVVSSTPWTTQCDAQWVELSPAQGESGETTVTVKVAAGTAASCKVSFGNGKDIATLEIVRADANEGGGEEQEYEPQTASYNGLLSGKFSVEDGGRQVRFAQGNLRYQPSTKLWRFADHQYDTLGYYNSLISETYDGWMDMFPWGTGAQPLKMSTDVWDYQEYTEWGDNPIVNGGNKEKMWRTLTRKEWDYLVDERPNADIRQGSAEVNGISGYVFLPDDWTLPEGLTFIPKADKYEVLNHYTFKQWHAMEVAGAVFLPSCGTRRVLLVLEVNNNTGSYWSATPRSYEECCAWYLNFNTNMAMTYEFGRSRDTALGVRLVRDCSTEIEEPIE